jgi:hypothetical protein
MLGAAVLYLVQVVLRACVGIDCKELMEMLCLIATPRLTELHSLLASSSLLTSSPTLTVIRRALTDRPTPTVFKKTSPSHETAAPDDLLQTCTSSTSSGRVKAVEQQLSEDLRQLVPAAETDVLTRALVALRLFELQQISLVLSELLTDPHLPTSLLHK